MLLDPGLEETRGHGQAHEAVINPIELDAREPARIDFLTDLGPQPTANPIPGVARVAFQPTPRTGACRHAGKLGFA